MGLSAVLSSTYCVMRRKNLGYSRLYTDRRTDAGAQPPGFTVDKKEIKKEKKKEKERYKFMGFHWIIRVCNFLPYLFPARIQIYMHKDTILHCPALPCSAIPPPCQSYMLIHTHTISPKWNKSFTVFLIRNILPRYLRYTSLLLGH